MAKPLLKAAKVTLQGLQCSNKGLILCECAAWRHFVEYFLKITCLGICKTLTFAVLILDKLCLQ